jgi:hypothetical protein
MTSESDRLHAEMERAGRQADHYARVAARLLNENRLAEARQYAALWRDVSVQVRWLLDLAAAAAATETDEQDQP